MSHSPERNGGPPPPGGGRLWSSWSNAQLLLWSGACLAGNAVLQSLLFTLTDNLFVPLLGGGLLGVLLPCRLLARTAGGSLASEFRLGPVRPAVAVWSAAAAAASLLPTAYLAYVSQRLHPIDPTWAAFEAEHLPRGPLATTVAFAAAVVVAPLAEELLFRGLLHRLGARIWGPWPAALLSAGAFALLHGQPWFLLGLLGLGLLLAYIFETTHSVTACAVAHALHNGVALTVLLAEGRRLAPEAAPPAAADAPALWQVGASLVLLALSCLALRRAARRA